MNRRLLLDDWCGESRAAVLENDRLKALTILRQQDQPQSGDIYDGRVTRLDASLNAAFVSLGDGGEAFLPASEVVTAASEAVRTKSGKPAIKNLLAEGQMVRVMVLRGPAGGKGIRLTTNLTMAGRYVVLRPFSPGAVLPAVLRRHKNAKYLQARLENSLSEETPGLLGRSLLPDAHDGGLSCELSDLTASWRNLPPLAGAPAQVFGAPRGLQRLLRDLARAGDSLVVDGHRAFAEARRYLEAHLPDLAPALARAPGQGSLFQCEGVDAEMENLLSPRVDLPGGGWLSFEETAALTAIDVNSGSGVGSDVQPRRALELNLAAVPELARQIRLRGLAGQIVVDFPRMKGPAETKQVTQAMTRAFTGDPQPVRLFGFSAMGLFELTRRRTGPSLREILCDADGKLSLESRGYALLHQLRQTAYSQPGGQLHISCDAVLKDWLEDGPLALARKDIAQSVEVNVTGNSKPGIRHV